jgi:hypothetical protein
MNQPFRTIRVFPGLDGQVLLPNPDMSSKDPWVSWTGLAFQTFPSADRSTASRLRTLADELDEAYKILDAREVDK